MSKGKYKRKQQRAQQKAKRASADRIIMEEKKTAENDAQAATDATPEAKKDKNPSRWKRIKDWTKREKTFTDWCIAAFTSVLAVASINQFRIMGGQLDTMRKDQRAWIIPAPIGPQLVLDKPILALLQYTNSGKTVARHFTSKMRIEIMNAADGPTFDYSNPLLNSWLEGNLVIPNSPMPQRIDARRMVTGTKTEEITFTQDLKDKYEAGLLWFSVEGIITYKDIFGVDHWTQFCGAISNPAPFAPYLAGTIKCAEYNNTDNN